MAFQRISFFSAVVALVFCVLTNDAFAQSPLAWDPFNTHGGTALAPTGSGGTGVWDLTTANWSNGGSVDVIWINIAPETAIFGGTAGTITVSSGINISTLDFQTGGYTLTSGSLVLGAGGVITTATGSTQIASTIGGADFTKSGGGTLTLSGANVHTGGTTVNAGTLLINNTSGSGSGSGSVIVNNSGTVLGGSGTMTGPVTVNSGATLAPGATANSTAILSTGTVTLLSATLAINVNGTTAGAFYDQFNVSGAITITGSTLALDFGAFTPAATDKFFIALNNGTDAVTGTFSSVTGLPSGFAVVYDADSAGGAIGNDIVIEAVPEPSTWCMAAFAAAFIGFKSRRRLQAASRKFVRRLTRP